MEKHQDIDRRSLLLAKAVVKKIETEPACSGQEKDMDFVSTMLKKNIISIDEIEALISSLPEDKIEIVEQKLKSFRHGEF